MIQASTRFTVFAWSKRKKHHNNGRLNSDLLNKSHQGDLNNSDQGRKPITDLFWFDNVIKQLNKIAETSESPK